MMSLEQRTVLAACVPHPSGLYGARWGNQRPPGLPLTARHTAAPAPGLVGDWADHFDAPPGLRAGLVQLSWGESRHAQGQPALNFEGRLAQGYNADRADRLRYVADPYGERRPAGSKLVLAWGRMGFNRAYLRDAIRILGIRTHVALPLPWELSAVEELSIPVHLYRIAWDWTDGLGLGDAQRMALLRLRHALPTRFKWAMRDLRRGHSFARAWGAHCPDGKKPIIAAHIDRAGLGVV